MKCGINPNWYIGATVVENVRFGVITSDPFLKLKDDKPKRFAEEPELTINPYFFPNNLDTVFSSFFTFGPSISVRLLFFKTSSTAFISLLS